MALSCNVNSLLAASAKYSGFSSRDKRALLAYLQCKSLAAQGVSQSCTTNTILANANTFDIMGRDQQETVALYLMEVEALVSGATVNANVNALRLEAACQLCVEVPSLEAILIYLRCQQVSGNKV